MPTAPWTRWRSISSISAFGPGSILRRDGIARRWPVDDLLAEQAADQFDGRARSAASLVQERIELDDVDRAYKTGIVQQLHNQVSLTISRAARHRGADAGRDI